jgi:hypothetical protein
MKKITYHSNSQYNVCCKIITKPSECLDASLKVNGNILEMVDSKGSIQDKYSFNFNKIFQSD